MPDSDIILIDLSQADCHQCGDRDITLSNSGLLCSSTGLMTAPRGLRQGWLIEVDGVLFRGTGHGQVAFAGELALQAVNT